MIDFAALRARTGLKQDCRCTCGSNLFGNTPLMVTNEDGRTLTSNMGGNMSCSLYILTCICGQKYFLSYEPNEQDNTLMPVNAPEATEFLAPSLPDWKTFDAVAAEKRPE